MGKSKALLNRVQRYSAGASRCMHLGRRWSGASRASLMSQAIAERYAAVTRRWPVLGYVFEQNHDNGVTVTNENHTTYAPVFVNPRVLLRLLVSHQQHVLHLVSHQQHVLHQAVPATRTGGQSFRPTRMALVSPANQQYKRQESNDIVARILRQSVRNESRSAAAIPPIAHKRSLPTLHPLADEVRFDAPQSVAKVFRQRSKVSESMPTAPDSPAENLAKVSALNRGNASGAMSQPAVDISRITDRVMQALDQRIVSQRERMGRV